MGDKKEHARMEAESTQEINKVSIKIPPFWTDKPEIWFYQVEAQFNINAITSEETKFNYLIAQLEPKYIENVWDIITLDSKFKYTESKTRLLNIFKDSESVRIKKLISGIELGNMKPSQLLQKLRSLATSDISSNLIKTLWLEKLPDSMRNILLVSDKDVTKLASMADKIMDMTYYPYVCGASSSQTSHNVMENLLEKISSLEKQVAEINLSRSRPSFRTQRQRSRSSSRIRRKYDPNGSFCYYHFRFGARCIPEKCKPPCKKRLIDGVTNLSINGNVSSVSEKNDILTLCKNSKFSKLLSEYPNISKPALFPTFPEHDVRHSITTEGHPVHSRARQLDSKRLAIVKQEFKFMLENNIIRPSKSQWASPLHMVAKKDGSHRICEGREFVIFTDHRPLIFAFLQKPEKAAPRQIRQLQFISQFSTDIRHVEGQNKIVADALSRIGELTLINYDEIAEAQKHDEELDHLRSTSTSLNFKQHPLASGKHLWCDTSGNHIRPYIPETYRFRMFKQIHGLRSALQENAKYTIAKLVYGQDIRLPGEFLCETKISSLPETFVAKLQKQIELVGPRQVRVNTSQKIFVPKELSTCSHVFLRIDRIKKSLEAPYEGPYTVLSRTDKYFTICVKGRNEKVSIDRLQPAYILADIDSDDLVTPQPVGTRPKEDIINIANNALYASQNPIYHRLDKLGALASPKGILLNLKSPLCVLIVKNGWVLVATSSCRMGDKKEHARMEAESTQEINKVSIKIPLFWTDKPEIWFYQVEAQFNINAITSEETKFNYLIAQLEPKYIENVWDIITLDSKFKYTESKTRLLNIFKDSESVRIKKLISGIELGNMKPSQLLQKLRSLATSDISSNLIKTLWLEKLPDSMRNILLVSDKDVTKLASMADKIMDMTFYPYVCGASSSQTSHNVMENLLEKISSLEKQVAEINLSRSRPSFRTQRQRSRSSSRIRRKYDPNGSFCYYHFRFGARCIPEKCKPPCKWVINKTKNQENSRLQIGELTLINYVEIAEAQKHDEELDHLRSTSTSLNFKQHPLASGKHLWCDTLGNHIRPYIPETYRFRMFKQIHALKKKTSMAANLTPPLPMNTNANNLFAEYKQWMESYAIFEIASGISKKSDEIKRATLLHCLGPNVQRIFFNLPDEKENYEQTKMALDKYFTPYKNVVTERFKFRQRVQKDDEAIDNYLISLRELSKSCEFGNLEADMIRDQIIEKCNNKKLKEKLLQQENLTLSKTIDIARMLEISRKEIRLLEPQNDQTLNRVQIKPKNHYNDYNFNKGRFTNQGTPSFSGASKPKCYRCGLDTHSAQECGAKKMTCSYCNKLGHLFRACRNRPNENNNRNHKNFNQTKVKTIQEENKTEVGESSDEYTYYTGAENKEKVQIDGSEINMIIDTGSDRTFISYNKMLELYGHKIMPKLHDTTRTFFAYGQDRPLPCYGYFNAVISWKENSVSEEIYVIDKKVESLLGGKASFELGIIKRVNHVNIETLVQEHEHLFHGLGTIKGYSHKVTLKDNYRPIAQRCRRIPYAMVEAVNQELDKMLENGIIEEVHQGSEWVSNIIVVSKRDSEEIRLCIDLREVNKAILRERHPIPTIDNMLHALKGAKVFAKLDAKKGFWQVDLDPQSRPLTTFITHRGCYRFCKVPFGLSSAPEAYQKGMDSILLDLKGVICYLNDAVVYAKDRQELEERLRKVLQRFDKVGIRLNRNKCKFAMEELDILGHIVSSEGIKPDNRKIEAVLNFPIPKNIEMLRSEHHVILENTSINSFKLVNTKNGKIIHRNAKHLKHVPTQETNQGISDLIPEESQENLSSDSTRIEHLNSSDVQIPDDNSSNQDKDTSLNRPSSSRTGSTFNPVVSDRLDDEALHQLPPE
ncbi:hypothetical protein LAZ67_7001483, partial [Cordylochernes scorpioides]